MAASNNPKSYDYWFKIVLEGDAGAGRTQFLNCFTTKDKDIRHLDHAGIIMGIIDYGIVKIDDKTIKALICDTGKYCYNEMLDRHYCGISGAMLVYNITDISSFTSVRAYWLNIQRNCPHAVIMLVGNCFEEQGLDRVISTEKGRAFAEANDLLFKEVSTDNVEQLNEAFMTLIREIYYTESGRSKEDILPTPKKEILPKPAKESIFDRWFSTKKREQTSNAIEKPFNQQKGASVANLESKQGHQKETQLQSKSRSDSVPKMESKVPESIFDRWFSTKKQTSIAIEEPPNHQKGASAANLESKQGHQKETQLQSKSRSDSTPRMKSKALGSKENAPSYHDNADEEMDRLSKTIDNLKQENRDQLAQHTRVNQQLQAEKENLERNKQQLQQHVSQLQSEITTLQDQLTATSSRKNHDNSSDDSWKVSHREVTVTQQVLGRGGWGVIWVGVFREQKVAVKQMHEAITCQVNLDLLHCEINTMAQLRHPNLLQFIGAVFDHPSGNPMIITEIMDTSLRKAYEDKSLTPSRDCLPVCVGIMRDVAVGLNYLHCLPDPIIHRDVSSANVLLESKGDRKWKTKISDFGSANKAKQAMTRAAGAAVYSAPESLQTLTITGTKRKLTTKMDVFSYGVLLCEVLNCRFPDIDLFPEMLQQMKKHYSSLHKLVCLCISEQAEERPVMKQVIETLDHST